MSLPSSATSSRASIDSSVEHSSVSAVDLFSSRSRDNCTTEVQATLESAPQDTQASAGATHINEPPERSTMIPFLPAFPTTSTSESFPDPLPSLSSVLHQNRMVGDNMFGKERVATQAETTVTTEHPPPVRFEAYNTLDENDWEELLSGVEPLEDYVSPDITQFFDSQSKMQGSQDLDISGREFLLSPAIPVIGSVPHGFGDMLVPIRLLDPAHPRQASSRYGLREKTRAAPILPSFESLRVESRAPLAPLRELPPRAKATGKSARTRLFASPPVDDKENQPENVDGSAAPARAAQALSQLTKPKRNPGKKPVALGRRSLDSVIPNYAPPLTLRASQSLRKSKDCSIPGCVKGARSKGLCKRHGGGKRCSFPDCARSDQGGGLCIAHGGGKRCAITACSNSAQSRGLCKSHGGGKRCAADGCMKSSQGGGFCRAHGGAKLCKAPVCFNYRHHNGLCRSHNEDHNQYQL